MKTIRLKAHVDIDSLLQIQLPEHHDDEVEALLVYQPIKLEPKRQWSQEFLDLFGSWEGVPLEKAPQELQSERSPML